jgi:hypothetical protein
MSNKKLDVWDLLAEALLVYDGDEHRDPHEWYAEVQQLLAAHRGEHGRRAEAHSERGGAGDTQF